MRRNKIFFAFLFVFYAMLYAQETDVLKKIEADGIFRKTVRFELNTLLTIESYMYYVQGIEPAETSDLLDSNWAMAESYHTDLELYNRKNKLDEFLKISGYWQNLRLKVLHSYKKGKAKDLTQKLTTLHELTSGLKNYLIQTYKLGYSKNQLIAGKSLYYSHYLSCLFISNYKGKDAYLEMLLRVNLEKYARLIGLVRKLKFQDEKDNKRFMFIAGQMENLYNLLEDKTTTPEQIYQQVKIIHNGLDNWLLSL